MNMVVRAAALVACAVALSASAAPAQAAIGSIPQVRGQTNGEVTALAQSGDRTYLGGTFTRFGVPVGFGASLAPASGAPDYSFAKPNGTVNAVVSDGAGGWFIGGLFSAVGTVERSRVAHILADGSVDPAFDPHMGSTSIAGISSGVRALARDGNTLYVGGDFNRVGTGASMVTRNFLAAIDITTGQPTSFDANLTPNTQSQFVETIAVAGSRLWVGGTLYANPLYSNLIAMDKVTGAVDPISEHTKVTPGYPQVLAANDGKLYIGGAFDTINGVSRSRMAAIDATTGAVDMAFNPNVSSAVAGIEFFGGKIYIGGNFLFVNGFTVARSGLAALDPVTGAADPSFNPGLTGWFGAITQIVTGTARSGSTMYVAGNFSKVGGTVTRNNLAAIDLTTGTVNAFDPNVDKPGLAIAADGSHVYAGGFFSFAGADSIATGVVALKPDGTRDTAFAPVISPAIGITSLAVAGGRLIVGSDFGLIIEGSGRLSLAALDLATGALVPSFDPKVNFGVAALAVAGGKVYAGGDFTSVNTRSPDGSQGTGGTPRNHLAAFDPGTGVADPAFDPNVDRSVYALALSGGKLYAGGRFTMVNGSLPRGGLAAFDPATGVADPAFNATVDDDVRALAAAGGKLYLGGSLRSINGATRRMMGAVDAATGALDPFNPDVLGQVRAILVSGGTVYVGGSIAWVNGGVERHGVSALDPVTGAVASDLGASFTSGSVNALLLSGSQLHVGGTLLEPDGVLHLDYARFSQAAPAVVSGAASAIGDMSATLAGTVNPGGVPATYVFEYGTSPAFGSLTPAEDVAGSTAAPVSAALTGLTPNTTYYYRLAASSSAGTASGTVRSFRTSGVAQAPLAVTGAASAVGGTSATVSGQVNPRGQLTAFTFEYGTTLAFGAISPVVALDDADALEPVAANLTGLAPGTTYYYRVVATNATGTALGAVATFTTPGTLAPLATTGAATAVTATGATLAGVVDPRGTPTAFTFEYGPTNAFGSISAVDSASGGSQPVSLPITGLSPGTQYRFRIVAANAFGTTVGTVGTFTTATGA